MGGWEWGWVWVCGGVPCIHACTCMHACMHVHTHTHTHMHVKHAKHDKHGCLHVGGHLQFLYMYICACMHVLHVLVCEDTPMPPDTPPPAPSPELQGAQNTKIQ